METSSSDELFGYPLSFAQRRLWFLDQLFPGTPLYNLPLVLHLSLPVDVAILERSLFEMSRRHESLRTTFRTVGGDPLQVVAPEPVVRLKVVPLDHLPQGERETAAMAFAAAELQRPFNLADGPLWRATLVRLDRGDHFLLLTAHHIVSDGWSMGLMLQELQALYRAFAAGEPSPLPELPLQYVDYAIWQHETLSSELVERQLAYWRETLADLPTIELPTDRVRPPTATLRGRRHHFTVPAAVRRALDDLGQREAVTPFMTLLSAYAVLLQRYTGETDLPIGTPIAGRSRAEFEPLIGFFVNTLVLRADLGGNPTFRELLRRVREKAIEAYTYQDLPFEKLVEELQPTRDLSRNPLFQVMFALQNAPTAGPEGDGAVLRSVEIETGVTNFDLALDVWRRGDGYAARIEYNVDLFDDETIDRLAAHWLGLLEAVARDPDLRLSEYRLIEADAHERIIHQGGQTSVDLGVETTVHALIHQSVARNPDAPAIISDEGTLTYGDLDARARQLARVLQARGVGPDRPVAVLLDRSPALVVSLLAIWNTAGVYVPLDPRDPHLRLRQVLEHIDPVVVVTTKAHEALCAPGDADGKVGATPAIVLVDEPLPDTPGNPTPVSVRPNHLAYVVYTSGSTGHPRGVAVEHRAIVNHLRWMQASFPIGRGDRVLQTTSIGFDVSMWELAAPLAAGAAIVLPPSGVELEPAKVVSLIAGYGVCALQTTPSFLRLVLDDPGLARCSALRWVFCGAESMPRALAVRFAHSGLEAALHNMYGPTESAIDAASYACPMGDTVPQTRSGSVPIGRPIANVRLYVLDPAGRPVPPGLPGELHIAGASLARGYWKRPDLTAERFVPDPFGGPDAVMYRTGDRVRALPTGELELLARMDRQVKVRGVRVEPAEIEHALAMHPHVRDAFVSVAPNAQGESRLVAYASVGASTVSAGELRPFLQARLTSAMIPSTFVLVQELPRTSRGKVDVRALERLKAARSDDDHACIAPRTELESAVAGIWQSLLGTTRVGVDDNFFDLGGHSLLATQVVSRVLERFGVTVPLRAFFEQPTVAGIAAQIARVPAGLGDPLEERIGLHAGSLAPYAVARLSDNEVDQLLRAMLEREALG